MKTAILRMCGLSLAMTAMIFLDCAMVLGGTDGPGKGAEEFLSIGQAGPKAVPLTITTDKPEGYVFKPGDSVAINVKAAQKAYVTALYLSSQGDVLILFPNGSTPDNLILPGKEYALFGKDSPVKLQVSDKMKEGKIVFFASSSPLDLEPLRIAPGQPCISIPHSSPDQIDLLKRKLEALAKDEGFSRLVLALKADGKQGLSLNLMGLPTAVKSEKPESIVGVQGAKPEKIEE